MSSENQEGLAIIIPNLFSADAPEVFKTQVKS